MSADPDRLYRLLPAVIRTSDVEQGHPLRDLLRVLSEQVDVLEDDIRRMYENLFIETCEQWVVPYIGDLVGYRLPPAPAGGDGACGDDARSRFLTPRRAVADTINLRQRKGTIGVVDDIALAVSGWPSAIEERYAAVPTVAVRSWRLQSWPLTRVRPDHVQRRVNSYALSVLGNDCPLYRSSEVEDQAETSAASPGIPRPIPIPTGSKKKREEARAEFEEIYGEGRSLCLYENETPIPVERITIADLSQWTPEVTGETVALDPVRGRVMFPERYRMKRLRASYHYGFLTDIGGGEYARPVAGPPVAASLFRAGQLTERGLRLRDILQDDNGAFTGYLRSLIGVEALAAMPADAVSLERWLCAELNRVIQAHDLSEGPLNWETLWDGFDEEAIHLLNSAPRGARRLRLNRILLEAVYPDAIAHAWQRVVVQAPGDARVISDAVRSMQTSERPPLHMVVELADSDLYVESIVVDLPPNHTFELRAAEGCRPTIFLPERSADIDDLVVSCGAGSRVILDGLMVAAHAVRIVGQPAQVVVRHCTLVPGWELDEACEPCCGHEPSLVLSDIPLFAPDEDVARDCLPEDRVVPCVHIDRSILGTILVQRDEVGADPVQVHLCASIVDATTLDGDAIAAPNGRMAHAVLEVSGCTVIGWTRVHAFGVGENSIFLGTVEVARRQIGCLRYSYVDPQGSRTPPRHACQPDLSGARPTFMDAPLRYGRPNYCRLRDDAKNPADNCPPEIRAGADDRSEMGVYHHLYQAQRAANLIEALQEYLPLGWALKHEFAS